MCVLVITQYLPKGKGKSDYLESRHMGRPNQRTLLYPLYWRCFAHMQLSIQPRICAPGTHYWGTRGKVDSKLAQSVLYMTGAAGIELETSRSRFQSLKNNSSHRGLVYIYNLITIEWYVGLYYSSTVFTLHHSWQATMSLYKRQIRDKEMIRFHFNPTSVSVIRLCHPSIKFIIQATTYIERKINRYRHTKITCYNDDPSMNLHVLERVY